MHRFESDRRLFAFQEPRYRESPPITIGSFVSRTISSKVGRRPDFIWLMNSVMGATVLTLLIPGIHHDKPRAGLPRMWRINMLEVSTGSVATFA